MPRIDREDQETTDVDGTVVYYTASGKAIVFHDGDKEVILPLSLVEIAADGKSITLPVWLATREGLV